MMSDLRRWLTRHPARWVLGALLAMSLGGAQLVATCHELSHAFVQDRADAGLDAPGARSQPSSTAANHDCPLCLIAAALGGVATAPPGPMLPTADDPAAAPSAVACAFVPRVERAYASRAPPAPSLVA